MSDKSKEELEVERLANAASETWGCFVSMLYVSFMVFILVLMSFHFGRTWQKAQDMEVWNKKLEARESAK